MIKLTRPQRQLPGSEHSLNLPVGLSTKPDHNYDEGDDIDDDYQINQKFINNPLIRIF